MINRDERLKGRKNFNTFIGAKHYRAERIRIAALKRPGRKAAFVAGKKVSLKAVDRNRVKRRLRELYRKNRHLLPEDIWLMIIALPAAAKADFASLEADINALFNKIASEKPGSKSC